MTARYLNNNSPSVTFTGTAVRPERRVSRPAGGADRSVSLTTGGPGVERRLPRSSGVQRLLPRSSWVGPGRAGTRRRARACWRAGCFTVDAVRSNTELVTFRQRPNVRQTLQLHRLDLLSDNESYKPVVNVARDAQRCVHTRDSSCRGQTHRWTDGWTDIVRQ